MSELSPGAALVALGMQTEQTVSIVSAYVSNNPLPASELPAFIASVHAVVTGMVNGTVVATGSEITRPTPAQIEASVQPDGITSFIDGKSYKMLRRHLTTHGHTPESYRRAYGLPADYPVVAPSYSEQRSAISKEIGLGRTARPGFANTLAA